jgi:hypothetical protein
MKTRDHMRDAKVHGNIILKLPFSEEKVIYEDMN